MTDQMTAQQATAHESDSRILDLLDRWAEAELEGDTATLASLLTPDFTGIGPVGFLLDVEQWVARHHGDLTNRRFDVVEAAIRHYGTTAVVDAVVSQETTARGHDTSGSFRIGVVAVPVDGDWLLARIQYSGPMIKPGEVPAFIRDQERAARRAAAPFEIDRDDLAAALGSVTVVDALPAAPYAQRHLPRALNVVAEDSDAAVRAALPDPNVAIVVYSTDEHCDRAPQLAARLREMGYGDVRIYRAGIQDWVDHGLPVESA